MKHNSKQTIYSQMQRFADVTKTLIIQGNIGRAKRCIQTAEDIFNAGTADIKNAISNVYIFSLSSFMELHHCNIRNFFQGSIQKEYYKQVHTSGI